jgi:hypothetical protein
MIRWSFRRLGFDYKSMIEFNESPILSLHSYSGPHSPIFDRNYYSSIRTVREKIDQLMDIVDLFEYLSDEYGEFVSYELLDF